MSGFISELLGSGTRIVFEERYDAKGRVGLCSLIVLATHSEGGILGWSNAVSVFIDSATSRADRILSVHPLGEYERKDPNSSGLITFGITGGFRQGSSQRKAAARESLQGQLAPSLHSEPFPSATLTIDS